MSSRRARAAPMEEGLLENATELPQPACQQPPTVAPPPSGSQLLPLWWLAFLPLYWFPQSIGATLVQTYIIPFQVEAIVGDANKHIAYSMMQVFKQIGSCFAPVWGALSDKLVTKEGRQRRRPMIVVGMLLWAVDTTFMGLASTYTVLLITYALYTATATVSGAPYVVVYPQVPTSQRGKLVAFDRVWAFIVRLLANGMAVLIGQKLMSRNGAYVLAVIMLPLSIPFGLMGLNETPGCWSREAMAAVKPKVKVSAEPGKSESAEQALRKPSLCARGYGVLVDFVSATRHPPFRWLFISGLCNSTYSTVQNLYFIYWFQDEVCACPFVCHWCEIRST